MSDKPTHIQVGYIQGVFGVKGWNKVFSYCRPKQQILEYAIWQLRNHNSEQTLEVEQGKLQGNGVIVKLKSIDNRNVAEELIGAEVWLPITALPSLSTGEYYWFQLIGLEVVNTQGQVFGKIKKLMETGANDVLVVQNHSDEILIPYIKEEVIKSVDLDKKIMTVDWLQEFS